MTTTAIDSPERARRAQEYFDAEHNLGDQRKWYDDKAKRNKRWHTWLGFAIILAGASTAVVQLWAPTPPDTPVHWSAVVTALLGAAVMLAKGAERIWSFDETWVAYRLAAEEMKSERRLYVNAAGPYTGIEDEGSAYRRFVERVEGIVAAEQRRFSQVRGGEKKATA